MSWKFWFRSGKHSPVIGYIVSWCKLEIHALGEPSDLKCGCMLSLSSKKFYTQRQSKLTLINFAMLNSHITGTYIFKIDQKHLIIAIIKKKMKIGLFQARNLLVRGRLHENWSDHKPVRNIKPFWKVVPFPWEFHWGNFSIHSNILLYTFYCT